MQEIGFRSEKEAHAAHKRQHVNIQIHTQKTSWLYETRITFSITLNANIHRYSLYRRVSIHHPLAGGKNKLLICINDFFSLNLNLTI